MSDKTYYPSSGPDDNGGVHRDDGVPNRAWSLATFGGIDDTTKRGVHASKALGWHDSETLYAGLIHARPVPTAAKFADLAVSLVGIARTEFGLASPQEEAVACSWYAVAVLSADDLRKLDVDPCTCPHPKTDTCDGGVDAGSDPDAGSEAEAVTPGVHCQIPFRECTTYLDFPSTTEADWAEQCTAPDEHGTLVPSCPTAGMIGCCTTFLRGEAGVDGTVVVCYYDPLSAASVAPACESALKGTWSSVEDADAGMEPDAAPDAASEPPSSGPTHC